MPTCLATGKCGAYSMGGNAMGSLGEERAEAGREVIDDRAEPGRGPTDERAD